MARFGDKISETASSRIRSKRHFTPRASLSSVYTRFCDLQLSIYVARDAALRSQIVNGNEIQSRYAAESGL